MKYKICNGSVSFLSSSVWPVIHYSFPIQYCPLDVENQKTPGKTQQQKLKLCDIYNKIFYKTRSMLWESEFT